MSSPVDGLIGPNGAAVRPPSVPVRGITEAGQTAGFGVAWVPLRGVPLLTSEFEAPLS